MSSDIKNIHFAVIGLGNIGRKHVHTIQLHPDAVLDVICDPASEHELWDGIPVVKSMDVMWAAYPGIQVVNICTPNGLHTAQAIECINQGKHVVVEKPFGLTKKTCEQVIYHALNRHVKIFCVMQNRYTDNARYLKTLVDTNALGEIKEVILQLVWNRDRRYYFMADGSQHAWRGSKEMDGGPLFTQFSHFIDLIYWLFGEVQITSAHIANLAHDYVPEIEDSGDVTFSLINGAIGSIRYSINAPLHNIISEVIILGSTGYARINGQYLENLECRGELLPRPPDPMPHNGEVAHLAVIDNVIHSITTGGNINTNAIEGMKVVEMIEDIYRKAVNS